MLMDSQHEDGVGEHDQVAASHQEGVKEDRLGADVRKALAGVGDGAHCGRRAVQGHFHELILPVKTNPG